MPSNDVLTSEANDMDMDTAELESTPAVASTPCILYDALLAETVQISSLTSNWFHTYSNDPENALTELINVIIRTSKCLGGISTSQLEEQEGMANLLETMQTQFNNSGKTDYPFTGRDKPTFYEQLISDASESQLWDNRLVNTLITWTTSMSSSHFRPFRHTATTIALSLGSALCFIGQRTTTTLRTLRQQLEMEEKKKTGRSNVQRITSMRTQSDSLASRQQVCDEMLDSLFDGIFVHRYRDIDPMIRVECVTSLGEWIMRYPDRFMDTQYIRYLGGSMSDNMAQPRVAALRALSKLHRDRSLTTMLAPLMERFKPQLLQLATREKDISVRVPAIQLSVILGRQGAWETDEERNSLCRLIVHPQLRIQKAIGPFCAQIIKEEFVEPALDEAKNKMNRQNTAINESWITLKAFALFCLQSLKSVTTTDDNSNATLHGLTTISCIVTALWHEVTGLKEWRSLIDLLAMDHSTEVGVRKTRKRRSTIDQSSMDSPSCYMLNEQEEAVLLNVLVISIQLLMSPSDKGIARRSNKQEAPSEEIRKDISTYLVSMLPILFTKYGPDATHVASLLAIVRLMDLTCYMTLNKSAALADLLEQVARAFLNFDYSMSMAQQTSMKLLEIRDSVLAPLWTVCTGKKLSTDAFSKEELATLTTAVTRIEILLRHLDVADILHECRKDETVGQLLDQLLDRMNMGRAEEVNLLEATFNICYRAILWMMRDCQEMEPRAVYNGTSVDNVHYLELARHLLEHCTKTIADGPSNIMNLKQRTFNIGCQLYWMISVNTEAFNEDNPMIQSAILPCLPEIQRSYAQFIEYSIEQYSDLLDETNEANSDDDDDSDDGDDHNDGKMMANRMTSFNDTEAEHLLLTLLGSFARCIISGVFDLSHAVSILASHGRFGYAFDEIICTVIEQANLTANHQIGVATHVLSASLKESFDHVTFKRLSSLDSTLTLARLLSSNMPSNSLVEFHSDGISFVISKMAGYHRVGNKRTKMDMLRYFRVLSVFTKSLSTSEATQILDFLTDTCKEHDIHPNGRVKAWDAYDSYVKQLTLAKEKSVLLDENRILDSPLLANSNQNGGDQAFVAMEKEHVEQTAMSPLDVKQMRNEVFDASFMSTDTPPRRHALRHRDISQQHDDDSNDISILDDTPTLRGKKRDFTASLVDVDMEKDAEKDADMVELSTGLDLSAADTSGPGSPLVTRSKRIRGRNN
ncbi:hypothetical protein BDF19DRAFT_463614 [Syncephalis fuscata]|nr:hypothetical protein BDF19DRAFT_463614 [Syncephalis fuscata]